MVGFTLDQYHAVADTAMRKHLPIATWVRQLVLDAVKREGRNAYDGTPVRIEPEPVVEDDNAQKINDLISKLVKDNE
jgi:hypothetical protein